MQRIASLTLVVGAVLLMTWALDPATAKPRPARPPAQIADLRRPAPPIEDIESEIKRLHTRLSTPAKYPEPQRDPFRFGRPVEPRHVEAAPAPAPPPAPMLPRLVAILSDSTNGAPVRRAALGMGSAVRILNVGDTLGTLRIVAITADDVELVDSTTGATYRIALR